MLSFSFYEEPCSAFQRRPSFALERLPCDLWKCETLEKEGLKSIYYDLLWECAMETAAFCVSFSLRRRCVPSFQAATGATHSFPDISAPACRYSASIRNPFPQCLVLDGVRTVCFPVSFAYCLKMVPSGGFGQQNRSAFPWQRWIVHWTRLLSVLFLSVTVISFSWFYYTTGL